MFAYVDSSLCVFFSTFCVSACPSVYGSDCLLLPAFVWGCQSLMQIFVYSFLVCFDFFFVCLSLSADFLFVYVYRYLLVCVSSLSLFCMLVSICFLWVRVLCCRWERWECLLVSSISTCLYLSVYVVQPSSSHLCVSCPFSSAYTSMYASLLFAPLLQHVEASFLYVFSSQCLSPSLPACRCCPSRSGNLLHLWSFCRSIIIYYHWM